MYICTPVHSTECTGIYIYIYISVHDEKLPVFNTYIEAGTHTHTQTYINLYICVCINKQVSISTNIYRYNACSHVHTHTVYKLKYTCRLAGAYACGAYACTYTQTATYLGKHIHTLTYAYTYIYSDIHLTTCIHSSKHPSIHPSMTPSIHPSIHPCIQKPTHMSAYVCTQTTCTIRRDIAQSSFSTCNCYFSSYPRLSRAKKQRAGWAAIGWAGSAHAAARPSATSAVDLGSSTTRERPSCNHNRTLGQAQLPGINYRSNHDSLEIQT